MHRRRFLAASGIAGSAALAGCSDSGLISDPALTVEHIDAPESATHGDDITINVQISNEGGAAGSVTISLYADETYIGSEESPNMEPDEQLNLAFSFDTGTHDTGDATLRAETPTEESSIEMHIAQREPANVEISNIELPDSIGHNEELSATLDVINTGDEPTTEAVALKIDSTTLAEEDVSLDGGESEEVLLVYSGDSLYDGLLNVEATTGDDSITNLLTVENPNPYGKETLVVTLEQETPARHDIREIITDALDYWNHHSKEYAGYDISYDYQPNTSDSEADVKITLVENIQSCGGHTGEIAGCAPLVIEQAPATADIRVVEGYRPEWLTTTIKHELGHTLGLDHDHEPAHIMSDEIEDRIPDYEERNDALDYIVDSYEPYGDGRTAWDEAVSAWEAGDFERTEDKAAESEDEYRAALRSITRAREIVQQLNESQANSLLAETEEHIDYSRRAASEAVQMARERQRTGGDPEPHRQAANDYLDESHRKSFHDHHPVAEALGFPG